MIYKFDKYLFEEVDFNGFNCLYFVVKGGNLSIFKNICKVGVFVEKKINEGLNILYIVV